MFANLKYHSNCIVNCFVLKFAVSIQDISKIHNVKLFAKKLNFLYPKKGYFWKTKGRLSLHKFEIHLLKFSILSHLCQVKNNDK